MPDETVMLPCSKCGGGLHPHGLSQGVSPRRYCLDCIVGVTPAQGRFLAYLDRAGHANERTAGMALYGPRSRSKGSITRMSRTLAGLGLIEHANTVGHRNLWNPTWQRTSKPYEVKS
jgi:hypothetical protein